MVKVSVNRYAQTRIQKLKQKTQTELNKLRKTLMRDLEEIFRTAGKIVKGETKRQRINGKLVKITLPQRRRWLLVAQKTALVIRTVASNINEKELKAQLEELEMLLNATKAGLTKNRQQTMSKVSHPKLKSGASGLPAFMVEAYHRKRGKE